MITHSVVETDRPARYAKQLVSHFSRKCSIEDVEDGSRILFTPAEGPGFTGKVLVVGAGDDNPGDLVLIAEADSPEILDRAQNVLGGHLVRFGEKDGLVVDWVPGDYEG